MPTPRTADGGPGAAGRPRRGGTARETGWFPLTVFGLEALALTPLYAGVFAPGAVTYPGVDRLPSAVFLLGGFTPRATATAVFWLVAVPAGYLATGAFYRARSRRHGAGVSATPFVATGLGLFALLLLTVAIKTPVFLLGDLFVRGLTPLITIALALFVLARSHRSRALALFAVAFLALAVLANLYDIENLTHRLGLGPGGPETNLIVVGCALVGAGAAVRIAEYPGRRRLSDPGGVQPARD